MPEKITENQRFQWMLLSLVLILALIAGLVLLVLISPRLISSRQLATPTLQNGEPAVLPTISLQPYSSPTHTFTPRPTQSPTPTVSPTVTPTPFNTPTPLGPATLTPARPLPQSSNYRLATWSPAEADHMIKLMEDYPNTLPDQGQNQDQTAYYQAFRYAVVALQESLEFFPDVAQAGDWRWDLAYNLARSGDGAAGQYYADLLSGALTRGEVEIDQLYTWFQGKEPRLSLYLVETQAPQGYLSSQLVEIRGAGSAFIWLVETTSGYQAFPLVSHFDFVNQPQAGWILADLDHSSTAAKELAVYFSNNAGDYLLPAPQVFDLSKVPTVELPFYPQGKLFDLGMEFPNKWTVVQSTGSFNDLAFQGLVFPSCPLEITLLYRWNGSFFEFINDTYTLVEKPQDLAPCEILVDHAANTWGPKAAISIMEPLLPDWPPEVDVEGQPYPLDAYDEWRYRLGVYSALLEQAEDAIDWMQQNVYTPRQPLSSWIEPSQDFLKIYTSQDDLYRACVSADFCDANLALKTMADGLQGTDDILDDLWEVGVDTHASGFFDFEQDGQSERWFTVRHRPLEALQFWILSQYSQGTAALLVGEVRTSPPQMYILDPAYVREDALQWAPVVFLDNYLPFSLQRVPGSLQPYLLNIPLRQEYPDKFQGAVDEAEAGLFSGTPPGEVFTRLVELEKDMGLLCQNDWSCDQYFYLRGLSADLDGNVQAAIEGYHRVWLDYSRSPYTTMARLKLQGSSVYLSPTPSPGLSPTGSPQISLTPTVTGTPPTSTPTPTGSPNPYITPSPYP